MQLLTLLFISIFLIDHFHNGQPNDEELLLDLLHEFLEGASVNDYDIHNRFWADDLIYTSSTGERFGKAEIMNGLPAGAHETVDENPVYSADEVQVRIFGDTALIAFILVADIPQMFGASQRLQFYNTGVFLKRDGEWRVIAWQATSIPQ